MKSLMEEGNKSNRDKEWKEVFLTFNGVSIKVSLHYKSQGSCRKSINQRRKKLLRVKSKVNSRLKAIHDQQVY